MHAPPSPANPLLGPSETSSLAVDLSALAHNWRRLAERCAPAECSAVVKANAYGLGLEPVMRALLAAGCETFFVACASEGERARAVSGEAAVYVFDGIAPGSTPRLKAAGLRPVLNSLAEIAEWAGGRPRRAAFRHRHEPAGIRARRGRRGGRSASGRALSGDEPSRIGAIAR